MLMTPQEVTTLLTNYFQEIDNSLEKLSKKEEEHLTGLPSWVLCTRHIEVAYVPRNNLYLVQAEPDQDLDHDLISFTEVLTNAQLADYNESFGSMEFTGYFKNHSIQYSDTSVMASGDLNALPVFPFPRFMAHTSADIMEETYSLLKAKESAVEFWNMALIEGPGESLVASLQQIFTRFRDMVKRKGFLERRIHRYLRHHAKILLPEHRCCFSEHELCLDGQRVVADLILDRGLGSPALLIELENPIHPLFTKSGDYTSHANHARRQISDWVRFIDENSDNTSGDMKFLAGPKQRLVVIGRGMDYVEQMRASIYDDATMWTYEMLIDAAKARWNNYITEQYRIVGIHNPNLLY
jgi:hypothetical protein